MDHSLNTSVSTTADKDFELSVEGLKDFFARMGLIFHLTVVIPTVLSIIYFGFIASNIYVSESRFIVRTAEPKQTTGLASMLHGATMSNASEDMNSVHDFIMSRDALQKVNQQLNLHKLFTSHEVDPISRFASFSFNDSFEALFPYYQKMVNIELDSASNIAILTVRAYAAEDAHRINETLLSLSENLVNEMNQRLRQDMIKFALTEVKTAQDKVTSTALAVSAYRSQAGIFDPEKQSALKLQEIEKFQEELMTTKAQLQQIESLTPENPQISSLKKRVETLQTIINKETTQIAGGNASLTNKASEYKRLMLEREFAGKQLMLALTNLQSARHQAEMQQLYLARIAQPNKPDSAIEPYRIRNIIATLILGLTAWGIITLLVANVREHLD